MCVSVSTTPKPHDVRQPNFPPISDIRKGENFFPGEIIEFSEEKENEVSLSCSPFIYLSLVTTFDAFSIMEAERLVPLFATLNNYTHTQSTQLNSREK